MPFKDFTPALEVEFYFDGVSEEINILFFIYLFSGETATGYSPVGSIMFIQYIGSNTSILSITLRREKK